MRDLDSIIFLYEVEKVIGQHATSCIFQYLLAILVKVKNVNWVGTLLSASRGAHLLFTGDWARLLNKIAVRGSPVLCTTSLLPSQPISRYPFIHLGREEQVRVKCLAQGHNSRPTWVSNSRPLDNVPEFNC